MTAPPVGDAIVGRTELARRWRLLTDVMITEGFDALLISGYGELHRYGSLMWAIGYCPWRAPGFALFRPAAEPKVLLPDEGHAAALGAASALAATIPDVGPRGTSDLTGLLVEAIQELRIRRLGVVGLQTIPSPLMDRLRTETSPTELIDADYEVASTRATKSTYEVRRLRNAAQLVDIGASVARGSLRTGITGRDLATLIEAAVRRAGATETMVIVSTGPNFVERPDDRPLELGDLVTVYVEVAESAGYWVEQAEMFALGDVGDVRMRVAEAALDALAAGASQLLPSHVAGDARRRMAEVADNAGLVMTAASLHGVGCDDRDMPRGSGDADVRLEQGMAVALHPQLQTRDVRVGGSAGATFLLDADGARPLSEIAPALHRIDAAPGGQRA